MCVFTLLCWVKVHCAVSVLWCTLVRVPRGVSLRSSAPQVPACVPLWAVCLFSVYKPTELSWNNLSQLIADPRICAGSRVQQEEAPLQSKAVPCVTALFVSAVISLEAEVQENATAQTPSSWTWKPLSTVSRVCLCEGATG